MNFLSSLLLRDYRYVVPIPACCLLQALFGLLYAQGVFVALVDSPEYTLSIGLASFFVSIGITLSGVSMSKLPTSPTQLQSAPVYTALLGSVGLSAQALLALALALDNVPLLYAAAVLYGTGCGCIYVASVDVLQAWMPEARGLITGVGMLCGAAGSLFGIQAYRVLVAALGAPIPAIAFVGAVSAALSFAAAPMLKRPPVGWNPHRHLLAVPDEERAQLLTPEDAHANAIASMHPQPNQSVMSVRDIVRDRSFYMLVAAFAATVGPGFGLVLAFQRMIIDMFGAAIGEANNLFFCITFTGLAGRLLAGIGVDALECDVGDGPRLKGGKRTNMLLLIVQIAATISLPFLIRANMLYAFTAACALIYITFSGGPVVAACLVGGVFDQVNASLAFSLIAISIGAGDMFFSWVVARCSESTSYQRVLHDRLPRFHANDYNLFILCTVIWSLVGLLATHYISRCDKLATQAAVDLPAHSFSAECRSSCSRVRHSSVSSVEDVFRSLGRAAQRSADETNIRVYTDMWSDT